MAILPLPVGSHANARYGATLLLSFSKIFERPARNFVSAGMACTSGELNVLSIFRSLSVGTVLSSYLRPAVSVKFEDNRILSDKKYAVSQYRRLIEESGPVVKV